MTAQHNAVERLSDYIIMRRNSRRTLIVVLASITGTAITAVTTPLLTRTLGSSLYGRYAVILSGFSLLVTVTDAGFFDGVRKYTVENKHQTWRSNVFTVYLLLATLLGTIGIGAIWFLFPTFIVPINITLKVTLSCLLLVRLLFLVVRGFIMALGSEFVSESSLVIQRVLYLVGIVILVEAGMTIERVFAVQLLTELLATGLLVSKVVASTVTFSMGIDRKLLKRLYRFSFYSGGISILYATLFNFDILLLNKYVSASKVGHYKIALVILQVTTTIPKSVRVSSVQSSSELWVENKTDTVEKLVTSTVHKTIGITFLLIIGLYGIGDTFLPIFFGSEFIASYEPLLLLLPGAAAYAISDPVFGALQGNNTQFLPLLGAITATITNVVLNLLLIPRYSIAGAAAATSISYVVLLAVNTYSSIRLGVNPIRDFPLRGLAITGCTSGLLIVVLDAIISSTAIKLVVVPLVTAAVYFILVPSKIYREEIDLATKLIGRFTRS